MKTIQSIFQIGLRILTLSLLFLLVGCATPKSNTYYISKPGQAASVQTSLSKTVSPTTLFGKRTPVVATVKNEPPVVRKPLFKKRTPVSPEAFQVTSAASEPTVVRKPLFKKRNGLAQEGNSLMMPTSPALATTSSFAPQSTATPVAPSPVSAPSGGPKAKKKIQWGKILGTLAVVGLTYATLDNLADGGYVGAPSTYTPSYNQRSFTPYIPPVIAPPPPSYSTPIPSYSGSTFIPSSRTTTDYSTGARTRHSTDSSGNIRSYNYDTGAVTRHTRDSSGNYRSYNYDTGNVTRHTSRSDGGFRSYNYGTGATSRTTRTGPGTYRTYDYSTGDTTRHRINSDGSVRSYNYGTGATTTTR